MHRASDYDRILISLAVAVLGAVVMTGTVKAQEFDRYGGEMRPVLNWSGKTAAPTPGQQPGPAPAAAQPGFAGGAYGPAPGSAALPAPPRAFQPAAERARGYAYAPRPAARPALPTSIYAAAPAAPTPRQPSPPPAGVAQAAPPAPAAPRGYAQGSVRHYSVHREFGIRPDPTPIPPQFFTATADLSAADSAEATPLPRTPPAQTGVRGRVVTPVAADPS